MTLDDLAKYHFLRFRQVQHLQLAQEYHQRQLPEEQVLHALLMWADAKHQADDMLAGGKLGMAVLQSRGFK